MRELLVSKGSQNLLIVSYYALPCAGSSFQKLAQQSYRIVMVAQPESKMFRKHSNKKLLVTSCIHVVGDLQPQGSKPSMDSVMSPPVSPVSPQEGPRSGYSECRWSGWRNGLNLI